MDFARAVTFPFEDEDWITKAVVGTLASLIPFIGPGYQVSVARNVVRGQDHPLPAPNELGQVLVDGIMAFLGALVYFVPMFPFLCVMAFMGALSGDSGLGDLMATCTSCCVVVIGLFYAIPATAMYWMGIIRYSQTGNFSEFVRLGSLWADVRQNSGVMMTLLAYVFILALVVSAASMVLWITCVGVPLLGFWFTVSTGHLIGQAEQSIR